MKEVAPSALGALETSLIEFPARFMEPIFIGERPIGPEHRRPAIGTATLLKLNEKYLAVTCHHVLAQFRRARRTSAEALFQIGNLALDPEAQLLSERASIDLATVEIQGDQIDKEILVCAPGVLSDRLSCSRFYEPDAWPPAPATEGEVVSFAGYPGAWKEQVGPAGFDMFMFGHGAAAVASASPAHFYTRLELAQCEGITLHDKELDDIGGASGGPVFAWRKGCLQAQLLGFITEYQTDFDLLYVRSSRLIKVDGTLLAEEQVPPRKKHECGTF